MKAAARRGQILILVLLIVVVALAVGLSVAARNITNLRTSAQTEQSQRAFSAAEGGVENTLSKLSTFSGVPVGTSTNVDVPVGNLTANVTVKSSNIYQSTIDLGSVGQVSLQGNTSPTVNIEWGKNQNCASGATAPFTSTIAVTQYAASGTQVRSVYQGCAFAIARDETGSLDSASGCVPSSGFTKCAQVTIISGAVLMRIRPFWEPATVRVSGGTVPQTYDISSTAQVVPTGSSSSVGGVTRTVKVQRSALPQLPAAFDYVLFSSGGISKGGS
jgi:Tfp pilus assembly protein PilX